MSLNLLDSSVHESPACPFRSTRLGRSRGLRGGTPPLSPRPGPPASRPMPAREITRGIAGSRSITRSRTGTAPPGCACVPRGARNSLARAAPGSKADSVTGAKTFRGVLRNERFTKDLTGGVVRLPQVARISKRLRRPSARGSSCARCWCKISSNSAAGFRSTASTPPPPQNPRAANTM